jgi:hypothetical protein
LKKHAGDKASSSETPQARGTLIYRPRTRNFSPIPPRLSRDFSIKALLLASALGLLCGPSVAVAEIDLEQSGVKTAGNEAEKRIGRCRKASLSA